MSIADIIQIASLVTASAGIFCAVIALRVSLHALRLQKQSFDVNSLFDIITKNYLDRVFESTDPPTVDDKVVIKTRPLKAKARKIIQDNPEQWENAIKNIDNWENKLAFELSIALERLGIAIFSGSIPLRFLLLIAADQLLEDWTICLPWVMLYRQKQKTVNTDSRIPFHRRYAELLVLLAAIWMHNNYPNYEPLKEIINRYENITNLKLIFINRFRKEINNIDPMTVNEIKILINIHSI